MEEGADPGREREDEEADAEEVDVMDEEGCVDLSSWQVRDLKGIRLPPTVVELDLTCNRLSSLDPRIFRLSSLTKLSLRQNLFHDDAVQTLSHCHSLSALQVLILRDNKLTKVPCVNIFKNLLVFDISFNEISSLEGISEVSPTLKELYVSKNEIAKIEGLEHLQGLQILELGSNRLRVMEGLQNMTVLQELWLGRNRICSVDLCGINRLTKISLQSNRLTSMIGFENCTNLEELYLSHNGISKIEGLTNLVNLRVLDVSTNKITTISGLENLERLEDLWLNDNQICSLESIESVVAKSRETLTTIYLMNNPCAKNPSYISELRHAFPNLMQIDSEMLTPEKLVQTGAS